nr:topless-related protein 4-like isoform X2 [Tanacetum cinerariifolium]
QCFKRIGYPDWYKGKKAKKNARIAAHVNLGFDEMISGDTPFDLGSENEIGMGQNRNVDQRLVTSVCSKMMKMFKGNEIVDDNNGTMRNYASTFAHAVRVMASLTRELVLLMHQLLDEEKYKRTLHMLEIESGYYFNMRYFKEVMTNGEWEEVVMYLQGFAKVEDNCYSMKIFFKIQKQKFLKALDRNDNPKACEMLYAKTARSITLDELKKLIEANHAAPTPLSPNLAGWMTNLHVHHPSASAGPIGFGPLNDASMLKHGRTPPTNTLALEYRTTDEHAFKRTRSFGISDEVNHPPVDVLPVVYSRQSHERSSYSSDDLPKAVVMTLDLMS